MSFSDFEEDSSQFRSTHADSHPQCQHNSNLSLVQFCSLNFQIIFLEAVDGIGPNS